MTSRNGKLVGLDTPKLRPGLQVANGPEPGTVVLVDQFRLGGPIMLCGPRLI